MCGSLIHFTQHITYYKKMNGIVIQRYTKKINQSNSFTFNNRILI